MHLYGEGLKAHGGVKPILLEVGAAANERVAGEHGLVVAEAQVDDALLGAGRVRDELRRGKDVVADPAHLPGDGVACAQVIQGLVQTRNAGGNAFFFVHVCASLKMRDQQPEGQAPLHQGDEREAEGEIPVPGLVAEQAHAERTAQCTAEKGEQKERCLRDAALAGLGAGFVVRHAEKEDKAHNHQHSDQDPVGVLNQLCHASLP